MLLPYFSFHLKHNGDVELEWPIMDECLIINVCVMLCLFEMSRMIERLSTCAKCESFNTNRTYFSKRFKDQCVSFRVIRAAATVRLIFHKNSMGHT